MSADFVPWNASNQLTTSGCHDAALSQGYQRFLPLAFARRSKSAQRLMRSAKVSASPKKMPSSAIFLIALAMLEAEKLSVEFRDLFRERAIVKSLPRVRKSGEEMAW
jgi:hypothetical protein